MSEREREIPRKRIRRVKIKCERDINEKRTINATMHLAYTLIGLSELSMACFSKRWVYSVGYALQNSLERNQSQQQIRFVRDFAKHSQKQRT